MSDLIRQNSENLELKAIPTALTLLLLTVTILSDSNGLIAEADRNPHLGDDCSSTGGFSNKPLSYHEVQDNPGLFICCPTITCIAGTEAKSCDHHATTSCVECLSGTYQSFPFASYAASSHRCVTHTQCTSDSRLLQEGNSTADTVCECNLELGYYGKWPDCHVATSCPLGSQLHLSGECKSCPLNFHRSSENYTQCIPCSLCSEATQNIKNCTETHDTICSMDSTKVADGWTVKMVVVSIAIIMVMAMVILVLVYWCICSKRIKHREGTIVSSNTPSTSNISSNGSQEEGKLVPAKELTFTGIRDVSTNEIYGQNRVPCSASIPDLCVFKDYECRREPVILKSEAEGLLQNWPSLSQTSQSITSESVSSIIDLREEEQNSQARGAEQTVTMNGGQNIYGQNVVINIYQQDKHSCDV